MAPLPPTPISVLSLSVEPGTLALIIIVLAVAQAGAHGPNVLRSEGDWFKYLRADYLPSVSFFPHDQVTQNSPLLELVLVGLVQNQAQDSVFPWGTLQLREDRAVANAFVRKLRLDLKVSAASVKQRNHI